ncbi:DNA-binding transcriptional regulator, ArsR family [Devosia sp. YR412]|uniref:ArsR/SmtB family transcription factor n=1 Tax=Devosia sp. YR412 TaxID=1881030 RepID=UPI0008CE7114|nr:metalloregulator ArsR/SmtB family transcription factor [Devosia sp. YR412]SEQ57652.1 DNA-binding transcriptional regulator, ArsR family [Devosia sp. YR412]
MPPIAVLVALADPTRCRIIEILHDGPQPVHVLASSFKISRPAISRHLRVLKQARLISEKKLGRENRYALHAEKLKPVGEWVAAMREPVLTDKPVKLLARASTAKKVAAKPAEAAPPPIVRLDALPTLDVADKAVAPKPKREVPISQMGFDF